MNTLDTLSQTRSSSASRADGQLYIIGGAGPAGLFQALRLLQELPQSQVVVAEKRNIYNERKQCVQIPYKIASELPLAVREKLWDAEARAQHFGVYDASNTLVFPSVVHLKYLTFISIGDFQSILESYLKQAYRGRFFRVNESLDFCCEGEQPAKSILEKVGVEYPGIKLQPLSAIFATCGGGCRPRSKWPLDKDGKQFSFQGHGIYIVYKNDFHEDYIRNGQIMPMEEMARFGMLYTVANNKPRSVQLYTRPTSDNELNRVDPGWEHLPESFIERAAYGNGKPVTFDGHGLDSDAMVWFKRYRAVILKACKQLEIVLPDDSEVEVYYAPRGEYYWRNVVFDYTQRDGHHIPIFYT